MTIATVVLSGGQDSATCLGWALAEYGPANVRAVSFEYGQRHAIEIDAALAVIRHYEAAYSDPSVGAVLSIPHDIINIGKPFAGRSPLTSTEELETYADAVSMDAIIGDRVEKTFVPMRNAVFLMLAANRAICADSFTLVTGVCGADNANYPDCRELFVQSAQETINEALGFDADVAADLADARVAGFGPLDDDLGSNVGAFVIQTPLMEMSKAESVRFALAIPHAYAALAHTHTAYDGAYPPTGHDHASVLRAAGFEEAGVPDPLVMRAVAEGLMAVPETPNYLSTDVVEGQDIMSRWSAAAFATAWCRRAFLRQTQAD